MGKRGEAKLFKQLKEATQQLGDDGSSAAAAAGTSSSADDVCAVCTQLALRHPTSAAKRGIPRSLARALLGAGRSATSASAVLESLAARVRSPRLRRDLLLQAAQLCEATAAGPAERLYTDAAASAPLLSAPAHLRLTVFHAKGGRFARAAHHAVLCAALAPPSGGGGGASDQAARPLLDVLSTAAAAAKAQPSPPHLLACAAAPLDACLLAALHALHTACAAARRARPARDGSRRSKRSSRSGGGGGGSAEDAEKAAAAAEVAVRAFCSAAAARRGETEEEEEHATAAASAGSVLCFLATEAEAEKTQVADRRRFGAFLAHAKPAVDTMLAALQKAGGGCGSRVAEYLEVRRRGSGGSGVAATDDMAYGVMWLAAAADADAVPQQAKPQQQQQQQQKPVVAAAAVAGLPSVVAAQKDDDACCDSLGSSAEDGGGCADSDSDSDDDEVIVAQPYQLVSEYDLLWESSACRQPRIACGADRLETEFDDDQAAVPSREAPSPTHRPTQAFPFPFPFPADEHSLESSSVGSDGEDESEAAAVAPAAAAAAVEDDEGEEGEEERSSRSDEEHTVLIEMAACVGCYPAEKKPAPHSPAAEEWAAGGLYGAVECVPVPHSPMVLRR